MIDRLKKNYPLVLGAAFVFVLFAVCTFWTPLAGDDWGYAINGMKENPFVMAFEFYFSWSGRFFSELWGFVVAPNKWLWNILNPLLFTGIFVCVHMIANPGKNFLGTIVILFCMLYVSAYLRMETYTWIMGTTYVVPLFLSMLYFAVCAFHLKTEKNWSKCEIACSAFVQFYIGLTMENIAAVMVLAHALMILRDAFYKKSWKRNGVFLIISLISFVIMRSSPGSAYRLSENTAWLEMSFVEQILTNLPAFLRYTFYDNKYLVGILTIALWWKVFTDAKGKKRSLWLISSSCLSLGAMILLMSVKIYSVTSLNVFGWLAHYETVLSSALIQMSFWAIYIVYLFVVFSCLFSNLKKEMLLFFLLIAGASNLVMMISPIFGSRSSLYFYYFAIVITVLVVEDLRFPRVAGISVLSIVLLLTLYRSFDTVKRYKMVNSVHQHRMELLQYYLEHPEDKDVWLPRMPIYTVHSADIEEWDTYHMEVFKKYYGLSDECILHFYVEE